MSPGIATPATPGIIAGIMPPGIMPPGIKTPGIMLLGIMLPGIMLPGTIPLCSVPPGTTMPTGGCGGGAGAIGIIIIMSPEGS